MRVLKVQCRNTQRPAHETVGLVQDSAVHLTDCEVKVRGSQEVWDVGERVESCLQPVTQLSRAGLALEPRGRVLAQPGAPAQVTAHWVSQVVLHSDLR